MSHHHHPSNSEKGLRAPRLEPVPLPHVDEDYGDEKLWQFILTNDCYTFLPLLIFDNNSESPTLAAPLLLPKQLRRLSISASGNSISSHPRKIAFSSLPPPPTASILSPVVANSHRRPNYETGTISWRRPFSTFRLDDTPSVYTPQYPRFPKPLNNDN